MKKTILARELIAAVLLAGFYYGWSVYPNGVIFGILGGIPDTGEGIQIVPMGKWLLLFGVFLLAAGRMLEQYRKIVLFSVYRHKKLSDWWKKQFFMVQGYVLILCMTAFLVWWTMEKIMGQISADRGWIFLTFFLHLSCMTAILSVCDILCSQKTAAGVLILAEGISYVLSISYGNAYLAGGMYCRSAASQTDGFLLWVVYGIELFFIIVCYGIVPLWWKRGYLERKG